MTESTQLVGALIALADDHLILGHRLSEWCGLAPMLEEDLSLPNMSLDLLGQARNLYSYAAELEGLNRTEDDFAYLRSAQEYRNCLLVEIDNIDFAHTMLKQFFFAAYMQPYWKAAQLSTDKIICGIAGKAVKEIAYHLRHSGEWVIRMGDGTEESTKRMYDAIDTLQPYTDGLFTVEACTQSCIDEGLLPSPEDLRATWHQTIEYVFGQAKLLLPKNCTPFPGGRDGNHGESFGHLLAELQYMQRTYPGLSW